MVRTVVILNNSGKRVGSIGELRNVYTLGSYDPDIDYRIEVETLDDCAQGSGGALDCPVRSVGKVGLQYYFATDLRFINYPKADCIYPEGGDLELESSKDFGGACMSRLAYQGYPVFGSRKRATERESLEELAAWARLQRPGRWVFPDSVAVLMDGHEQ